MTDIFQEIRDQIHDLRNEMAPVDFKLANLAVEIEECRTVFEEKAMELEAKVFAQSLKVEEQGTRISNILERLQWIELALNISPKLDPGNPLPVNGEKVTHLPPLSPAHGNGHDRS